MKGEIANQNDLQFLSMTKNGLSVARTRCTVGGTKDLIQILEMEMQPIEALLATIRALSGYFYPVENLAYTGELAYYRQREWRIVGNMVSLGVPVTQDATEEDVNALIALDPEFFGREFDFPTGRTKIAAQCQFYKNYLAKPIHAAMSRLVVPERVLGRVDDLLRKKGVALKVVSLESLATS